MQIEMTIEQDS